MTRIKRQVEGTIKSRSRPRREFGRNLRSARLREGWSQDQLSERSGIPQSRISQYERDDLVPSVETLWTLADTLGLLLDCLVGRTVRKVRVKPQPVTESTQRSLVEQVKEQPLEILSFPAKEIAQKPCTTNVNEPGIDSTEEGGPIVPPKGEKP